MYYFTRDEYKAKMNVKDEIRKRAGVLFTVSLPAVTTLISVSFASNEPLSCAKIILLVLGALFFVFSLVYFFMIVIPSYQLKYNVNDIINETLHLYNRDDVKLRLKNASEKNKDNTEKHVIAEKTSIAYEYFSSVYAGNIDSYDKKNKMFKNYFIVFVISTCLSIMLLILSIGV